MTATDHDIVRRLGSSARAFFGNFHRLREIQRQAAGPVRDGQSVLLVSATASGKTEAVMAPLVARLVKTCPLREHAVRLLVVAPTRALVNDLVARIEGPLERLALTCGRQTGDWRDKARCPYVLVTTPESLDSMLVRDGTTVEGRIAGHSLAGVNAVFIDEAHLFDNTARGDQLSWLLGRLRRVRRLNVSGADGEHVPLQICAASATVGDAEGLAGRLLGADAVVLKVSGAREVSLFGPPGEPVWRLLKPTDSVLSAMSMLEALPPKDREAEIERRLWQALSGGNGPGMRKALVFVPTRRFCDRLSTGLHAALRRRRDIVVLAHHGSLERDKRQNAERAFAESRDAVMVATTTLEVGIDIGDVDFVALVGAPPGTQALMQRIGRAGRRVGGTRILALPRTEMDRAAMASMLISTRDGRLEPGAHARRWSVFVQQAASFTAQNGLRGRRRGDLLELAQDVWPDPQPGTAEAILDRLIDARYLDPVHGKRVVLGEAWADAFGPGGRGMHANMDSPAGAVPVVDSGSGQTIAHVEGLSDVENGVALGGQLWDAQIVNGEVLLSARGAGRPRGSFRYAARRAPVGLEFATHVRRGLGFDEVDAPLVSPDGDPVWLHFGGSAYQTVLAHIAPSVRPLAGLQGVAMAGQPGKGELRRLASSKRALCDAVESLHDSLKHSAAPGRYHSDLPEPCRKEVISNLFDVPRFVQWLATRRVWGLDENDPRRKSLNAILSDNA